MDSWRQRFLAALLLFALLCAAFGIAEALHVVRAAFWGFSRTMGWFGVALLLLTVLLRLNIKLLVPPLVVSFSYVVKLYLSLLVVASLAFLIKIGLGLQGSFGKMLVPGVYGTPERLGIGLAAGGCLIFFQEWLFSLGYPPGVYGKSRTRFLRSVQFSFGCYLIWGVFAAGFFERMVTMTLVAAAMMTAHSLWQTRNLAVVAYKNAAVARCNLPQSGSSSFWCVHITDAHLNNSRHATSRGWRRRKPATEKSSAAGR